MRKTHKTCKECDITYEIIMFNKKGKYKYMSKCKLCFNPTGRSFSKYSYPIAEMQKIAIRNANRISRCLYLGNPVIPVCIRCAAVTDRNGKLCSSCKKKALQIKERKDRPIKEQRRIKSLSDCYVRKRILNSSDRYIYGLKPADISQNLVELKRKQILVKRQLKSE